jgi:hypothetical protein
MTVISLWREEGSVALFAQVAGGVVVGFCAEYDSETKLLPGVIGTPIGELVGTWTAIGTDRVPPPLTAQVAAMQAWLEHNRYRVH